MPESPSQIYGKIPFKFDLFAGIGGFRCALTLLGGKCVFTNEWDKYASITYNPGLEITMLILKISENLTTVMQYLIMIFYVQAFLASHFPSLVFQKNSLGRKHGFDDVEQGNLFEKIMHIVDAKRPPILFLENVKNLKSHDKGNTWKRINEEVSKRNYMLFSQVINAKSYVPQRRERIFIVCFDKEIFGSNNYQDFTFPEKSPLKEVVLESILEKKPDIKYMLSDKLWNYLKLCR